MRKKKPAISNTGRFFLFSRWWMLPAEPVSYDL
jgi:hypothetical protein